MLTLVVHSVGPKAMIKVMKTEKERGGQREQQNMWVAGGVQHVCYELTRWLTCQSNPGPRCAFLHLVAEREIVDFQYTQQACSFASDPKLEMKDASFDIQVTVA